METQPTLEYIVRTMSRTSQEQTPVTAISVFVTRHSFPFRSSALAAFRSPSLLCKNIHSFQHASILFHAEHGPYHGIAGLFNGDLVAALRLAHR